jgi:LysM repeat protein
MAEEPETSPQTEIPQSRRCPACGSRVAEMATTCLMCGASLVDEGVELEEEREEETRRGLPGWVRALIVVGLALLILSAGIFGYYKLMTAEPPPPEEVAPPSPTPIPTHTPIPPVVHQVQEGETLIDIANRYDITIDDILGQNPEIDSDLIQVGQIILIPPPTPTPGPTSTLDPNVPTPTPPEYIVHIVSAGEVLSTIAEEYGVSVAVIKDANDLPADDDTIRVNQSLIIPLGTPAPSPTPTMDPNATSTPVPPYSAPSLLGPANGAEIVVSQAPVLLQWASVGILADDEWYQVTLLKPPDDEISAQTYTRATAWRVPLNLQPIADVDRPEFRWQVQVVRETRDRNGELAYEQAGIPSEVRVFTWLVPTPTPTPTPSP